MMSQSKQTDEQPTCSQTNTPIIELLERPPQVMRRPLCLLDGHAYAATWLDVAVTYPMKRSMKDKHVQEKPKVKHEQRLYIVRNDGVVFGDGASASLTDLPFRVDLPEIPPQQKCWTMQGVSRFQRGERPDPAKLFLRLVDVIDQFIDFSRSLTDQRTMAELLATYVFATWLLEVFNVIGYLWPSGEHGSGKTQVLLLTAELSYLGMVIQAGGSYATLRDMADYGATLAFDDAEDLASPRRTDPDKRTLLLAGNRRGSYVTVKEPAGKGRWRTRYVNAFCPRLFSAIELPDSVLASRNIVLPLVRTMNRSKANAEPLDFKLWPHERQRLVDDLWAMATACLPDLVVGGYDDLVAREAQLSGRNLEPWRAILAVARWLDDVDEQGRLQATHSERSAMNWAHAKSSSLYHRLEVLSVAYQAERSGLETDGATRLVVRALCHCAIQANNAVSGGWGVIKKPTDPLRFTVAEVKIAAQELAIEDGFEDADSWLSNRKVGWVLSRLRLKRAPRPGGKGSRMWQISLVDLQGLATAYGVAWPTRPNSNDSGDFRDTSIQDGETYFRIARWVTGSSKDGVSR